MTWRATRAEIDLDALRHNIRCIRDHVGAKTAVMAVVKADAYGHGAVRIARSALEAGAAALGVATSDEALNLRETEGFDRTPILVMGPTQEKEIAVLQDADVAIAVSSRRMLRTNLERARKTGRTPRLHLQIDTGIGRDGIRFDDYSIMDEFGAGDVRLEGLFTHFSVADGLTEEENVYTQLQQQRFEEWKSLVRKASHPIVAHSANSGAILRHPDTLQEMVRPGMMIYGVDPAGTINPPLPIKPVLTLKTELASIRTVQPGDPISYGRTWVAPEKQRIGILPVGYGDGYHRAFSSVGSVLIRGKRAPIRGRVCMDQFMVDLVEIPEAREGDEVVLYGAQGDQRIYLEEAAAIAGTIPYELTCALVPRTPRVYHG